MDIVAEIDEAFQTDPLIDELGFMVGYDQSNILLTQHKLGISTKCLKKLFKYVSSQIRSTLSAEIRVLSESPSSINGLQMASLTRAALIVRADNPLALNLRKHLLLSNVLHFAEEIKFLSLLFGIHPKSPSCWEHRRWCLNSLHLSHTSIQFKDDIDTDTKVSNTIVNAPSMKETLEIFQSKAKRSLLPQRNEGLISEEGFDADLAQVSRHVAPLPQGILEEELQLCTCMADLYTRNYYAWLHRIWLCRQMTSSQIQNEKVFTNNWIATHISDYSATSYQLFCLKLLEKRYNTQLDNETSSSEMSAPRMVVKNELDVSTSLLLRYPSQENLWLQRRALFCMHTASNSSNASEQTQSRLGNVFACVHLLSSSTMNCEWNAQVILQTVLSTKHRIEAACGSPYQNYHVVDREILMLNDDVLLQDASQLQYTLTMYFRYLAYILTHSATQDCAPLLVQILLALSTVDVKRRHLWLYQLNKAQ